MCICETRNDDPATAMCPIFGRSIAGFTEYLEESGRAFYPHGRHLWCVSRGESALRSFVVARVEERGRNTYLRLVDISVNNISLDSAPEHGLTSATVMTVCIAARFVSGVVVPQPELHVL
jgi:hypothetical protein